MTAEAQQQLEGSDPLLENMNAEQAAAIRHTTGPLCVLAGAGSGKTRVLVQRVAYLVRGGVDAARILAVTFSKNAADEMKARGEKLGLYAEFRTWHSLALHILRDDDTEWAGWKIDDTNRALYLLKDVIGYKGMDWKQADIGQLTSFIGYCKSQLWTPTDQQAFDYAEHKGIDAQLALEAFERYCTAIDQNQLLTFDDMLVFCVRHLNQPGIAEKWAGRWDYVMQDEAQDASPSQLAIAKLLAYGHKNYMVVGDPAQSLYSFRGAAPKFIMGFRAEWDAAYVTMHRNYRCGSRIIDAANNVIRPSTQRLPTDISAEGGWEGVVDWRQPDTLEDEGVEVAGSVKEHVSNGSRYADHAVLYRLNAQSRGIEEALLAEKIPYVVVGGVSFYERKEVKDLLAYLRIVDGRQVRDSLKRSINAPFRFLGNAYVEKVMGCLRQGPNDCQSAVDATMDACGLANVQQRQRSSAARYCDVLKRAKLVSDGGARPDGILQGILESTGYEAWLKSNNGEESLESSHVANVKELVRVATRFATVAELLDFIDATNDSAKKNAEDSKGKDRVVLMSIHKSKGLEFRHVAFVGACEMIIPHPRAEDLDEERRLAYVAITRAEQTLLVTSPRHIATKSGMREVAPSRFVVEAGLTGDR
jgi:DNA helicase-2/ATP-dependent DNA helicase PcrA